jgi:hypothetical protein
VHLHDLGALPLHEQPGLHLRLTEAPVRVVVVDRDGEDLPHGHLVPGDGDPARLAAQMGQVGELHHVLP